MFKQRSGFRWRKTCGTPLWQEGFHEHVLRNGENFAEIVAYLLNNPVRAGLCATPEMYPYLGSGRYSFAMLADVVQIRRLPWQ
jgi:hypothetical protein